MWETSNSPAAFLVAWCSSNMEEYHIGNSHPWKSTIFPPCLWCAEKSAVRLGAPMANALSLQALIIRYKISSLIKPKNDVPIVYFDVCVLVNMGGVIIITTKESKAF